MLGKKQILWTFLIIVFLGTAVGVFFFWQGREANKKRNENTPVRSVKPVSEGVSVFTDKETYQEGEVIEISVKNGLDRDVFCFDQGDKFWSVEYFEEGKWERFGLGDGRSAFQLADPEKELGEQCDFLQFERPIPKKFSPQSLISVQWNQKICSFDSSDGQGNAGTVGFIGKRKYRISFYYGFDLIDDQIITKSSAKLAYSEPFIIK